MRVEQQSSSVGNLRHGRGVRTGHGAAAGHSFENGQPEAFVERRKHEAVAGVIEVEQYGIGHEAREMDTGGEAASARRGANFGREPGFLPGQNEMVFELRMIGEQLRESGYKPDLVLARLEVRYREDERRVE